MTQHRPRHCWAFDLCEGGGGVKGKRHMKGPRAPRPRLLRVDYRDQGGTSSAVFEVPAGVSTRREAETLGTLRYTQVCGWWKAHGAAPTWARSWGSARQLAKVRLADPDTAREPRPGAFAVDAVTWCGWPVEARGALRAVTCWTKGPGVMASEHLDGPTADRVRNIVAQHGLDGLEELRTEEATMPRDPAVRSEVLQ